MSRVFIIIIPILFYASCSCPSVQKNSEKKNISHRSVNQTTVPPGSVKINAEIINITTNKDGSQDCTILINEVIEYGHSTPPVSAGSKLLASIPKLIYDEHKIEKDKSYLLVIKNIMERQTENKEQSWLIINIE